MPRPILIAALTLALAATAAPADAATCPRFVVGEANSSAYPRFELPARGFTAGAPCSTLRRVARRLHAGTYRVPADAGRADDYGSPFRVRDAGVSWSCRLWNVGGSGPTYRVVCARGGARVLSWNTG